MTRNTISATVSTMPANASFLSWATGINASGLFRVVLAEQMAYRDIDCNEPSSEVLTGTSRDLDDLLKQTSNIGDLNALLETDRFTD